MPKHFISTSIINRIIDRLEKTANTSEPEEIKRHINVALLYLIDIEKTSMLHHNFSDIFLTLKKEVSP